MKPALARDRSALVRAALWLACAAAVASGCTTRTVRPVERRIVDRRTIPEDDTRPDVVERLEARIAEEPNNPKWYFELGTVYELRREYAKAEELYRKGKALIPPGRYTGPDMALARVLIKAGRPDEALHHLRAVVATPAPSPAVRIANPDYRDAYYLIGVIHFNRGELEAAEQAMREFVRLGGDKQRVAPYFPQLIAEQPLPEPAAPAAADTPRAP